jgi:hypothetical protein
MDDQSMSFVRQQWQSRRKSFQFLQRKRPNLVAGIAMQRQFNRTVNDLPRKRFAFELVHAVNAAELCET